MAASDHEATDSLMQQSIRADADFPKAHQRRGLRNWFLLANVVVWIGIIALIRWFFF
ncbi:MAG: hypothetical protein ACOY4O_18710 [Pseudomonadota bacterium]